MTENSQTLSIPIPITKTETGLYATQKLHPALAGIRRIMPSLGYALGPECELVHHDFTDIRHPIVAIEGSLTNRSIGSP